MKNSFISKLTIIFIFLQTTVSAQTTAILKLNATGEDTFFDNYLPNQNNPNEIEYFAGAWTIGTPVIWRSLFKFNLSAIPPNATIISAHLNLYYAVQNSWSGTPSQHNSLTHSNESAVVRVTSPWSENTVTWNTQPSFNTINNVILPQSVSGTQDYPGLNVTAMVQDMYYNPATDYGFMLKLTNEIYYANMIFASGDNPDASKHPELVIVYALPPVITPVGSTSLCFGSSVVLTSTNASSYLWSNGETTQSIIVSNPGSYFVLANYGNGVSLPSLPVAITVTYLPAAPGVISGPKNGVCINSIKNYSVPFVSNVVYNWTPPAGASILQGQGNNSITVSFGPGFIGGDLFVTASNKCGESVSTKQNIKALPVIYGSIIGSVNANCSSSANYFIHKSNSAATYTWVTNIPGAVITTNPFPGDTAISVSFPAFVSGTISVYSNNACGASKIKSLTVKGTTGPAANIAGNTAPCYGSTQIYTVPPIAGATSYQWNVPTGTIKLSGANTNSISLLIGNSAGKITVKGVNACGTGAGKSLSITVPCKVSSFDIEDQPALIAYPNPTINTMQVSFITNEDGNGKWRLTDLNGRELESDNIIYAAGENNFLLNLSNYCNGIYVVHFTTNEITRVVKVFKQ